MTRFGQHGTIAGNEHAHRATREVFMGTLRDILATRHGIDITEQQEQILFDDLHAIMEINKTMNLTRILSEEDGMVLHLEDSVLGLPYVNDAPVGLYGDLGTGGGFPGIPLCVLTGRETLLVDSVKKKVRALEPVAEELGIGDRLSTYSGRIEDLALERPREFSVLTARALSSLGSLLELASPLLRKGGRLVCYKAQPTEEELEIAFGIMKPLGFELVCDDSHELSDGSTRRIFVFQKAANPRIALPRRVGMAQRNPLTPADFAQKSGQKSRKRR